MNLYLSIRTDKPKAEVGLFANGGLVDSIAWKAHLQLAETINLKIDELLNNNNYQLKDLNGIIFYKGPGSFTGLRIGAAVANTLAWVFNIKIIGLSGKSWPETSIDKYMDLPEREVVVPEYGQEPNTTLPKK